MAFLIFTILFGQLFLGTCSIVTITYFVTAAPYYFLGDLLPCCVFKFTHSMFLVLVHFLVHFQVCYLNMISKWKMSGGGRYTSKCMYIPFSSSPVYNNVLIMLHYPTFTLIMTASYTNFSSSIFVAN